MRQLVLELPDQAEAALVLNALEGYRARLRLALAASAQALSDFERRYGTTTGLFLSEMAAEDLRGGDDEYVQWAGEAKLLNRLEAEIRCLEGIRCDVP